MTFVKNVVRTAYVDAKIYNVTCQSLVHHRLQDELEQTWR